MRQISGGHEIRPRGGLLLVTTLHFYIYRYLVWACGASRWAPSLGGLTIPFIIPFKSLTTYSNCTTIYCTILLFEYALITIRETASFSKGCSRVCLLGLHAATSPRLPVLVPLNSYFTCSFDRYRYMYRYLI